MDRDRVNIVLTPVFSSYFYYFSCCVLGLLITMSQNGTTPTTDENRPPASIPTSVYFPMVPMFIPYNNASSANQQYYGQALYPNIAPYPSNGTHRHTNYGIGYNPFYAPFYPTQTNLLPPMSHISGSSMLIPPRPLMSSSLFAPKTQSSTGSLPIGNDNERNKNLNIRECQSPVLNETRKEKKPLQIIEPNDNHNTSERIRKDSSSASSLISHLVSSTQHDQHPSRSISSTSVQEIDSDSLQDDFLTFIEQKTKTTAMPELNPFASEFSFVNSKTLSNELPITTNGIDHLPVSNENQSSYRLLFDNLIEKSLESIEAIKKSAKKTSVNDISVQCNQINDCVNRSTQTVDQTNHVDLITDYSLRTIKLMDELLANFRNLYSYEYQNECKTMAQTCDELRHLILFIHRLTSSLSDHKEEKYSLGTDATNPFSILIQDLTNDTTNIPKYPILSHNVGRGTRRLITSTTHPSIPSFSCRQIDPVTINRTKLCLLCQKPLDDGVDNNDDIMHKLCRSLISRPNMSTNT
ncbi:hypothetical protein I4U23_006566 [Adineta vaga]|nr:hypothetical protein I4U23_006566 [Adineta vaga]